MNQQVWHRVPGDDGSEILFLGEAEDAPAEMDIGGESDAVFEAVAREARRRQLPDDVRTDVALTVDADGAGEDLLAFDVLSSAADVAGIAAYVGPTIAVAVQRARSRPGRRGRTGSLSTAPEVEQLVRSTLQDADVVRFDEIRRQGRHWLAEVDLGDERWRYKVVREGDIIEKSRVR